MNLPLFIAGRYLFAKKSHNVINIISAISAAGMAIGTAALIIILSVYNGFDDLIKKSLDDVDPDLMVVPVKGKVFIPEGDAFDWAYANPDISSMCTILEEEVFISYEGRQGIARARGVDDVYEDETAIRSHVRSGEFSLHFGDLNRCAVAGGLAYKMGINPNFVSLLDIYFPARDREVSLANPLSSLEFISIHPCCTFSVSSDTDDKLIILPISSMRELLGYNEEVSSVEIRLNDGLTAARKKQLQRELEERLPDNLKVMDRIQQNEAIYKMMQYEKAAIFIILIFIIIIIAFNIFGSLSMLVIEKREDIDTLRSLGARNELVHRIFVLEGWLISLIGLAAGLIIGLGLALIQQKFGLIPMPGNFIVTAYPVTIKGSDIAVTSLGVALIGYLISSSTCPRKKL